MKLIMVQLFPASRLVWNILNTQFSNTHFPEILWPSFIFIQKKNYSFVGFNLHVLTQLTENTQGLEIRGSEHSSYLICSLFLHSRNFDPGLFRRTWPLIALLISYDSSLSGESFVCFFTASIACRLTVWPYRGENDVEGFGRRSSSFVMTLTSECDTGKVWNAGRPRQRIRGLRQPRKFAPTQPCLHLTSLQGQLSRLYDLCLLSACLERHLLYEHYYYLTLRSRMDDRGERVKGD
jgi:hypothetical protein